MVKDRNGKDLIEEQKSKRWQEYTEKTTQKGSQITKMVWPLSNSQSSWSVKTLRALGNITTNKVSGGDGIPVELFKILKDDAVKLLQYASNLENSAVATGLEMVSFQSSPKEGQCQEMFKLPPIYTHFTS